MADEMVSAAEAARILGISRQRVSTMVQKGVLPGEHRRHRVYVPLAAVQARLDRAVPEDPRLTTAQVASALGVTPQTVRKYVEWGLLRAERVAGYQLRFDPGDVATFVRPVVGKRVRDQPYNLAARRRRPAPPRS